MKIVLVQTAFLGDVVLATPIIAKLKEMYPEAELWMLTTVLGQELLKLDPRIAGIITFDKRRTERGIRGLFRKAKEIRTLRFDLAYSLHKSWRTSLLLWLAKIPVRIGFRQSKLAFLYTNLRERSSATHEVMRNFSLLQMDVSPSDPAVSLSLMAPDANSVSSHVQQATRSKAYIAVFPGSAWRTKRWSADGYRTVVQQVLRKGMHIILLGSDAERDLCSFVKDAGPADQFAGDLSLAETMYVVKHAKAVLCNDSMALHVASAFKVPCVAVFCATSPEFGFGPWQNRHIVVENQELSCKPCTRHGGQHCPTGTERCMNDINPLRVVRALEEVTWVN